MVAGGAVPPRAEPDRPCKVVSAVDTVWLPTPARRAKKMQVKACMLHADAVIDRTEPATSVEERETVGPWGVVTTTKTTRQNPAFAPGKGYAIRWVRPGD